MGGVTVREDSGATAPDGTVGGVRAWLNPADALIWLISVLGAPRILLEWASWPFVVVWSVVHTIAFWWYVYNRSNAAGGSGQFHFVRMASSIVVWASVPISALVAGPYVDHEPLVVVVTFAFVSLRAIVPPDEIRMRWEIDGAVVGAVAATCSFVAGRPLFGAVAVVGTGLYLLAEQGQVAFHRQRREDRAALDHAMQRMTDLAHTDQLTSFGNRRAAREWLDARVGGDGAVMLLDIDDFKVINDRHGHQAGDGVLIAVAEGVADRLGPAWQLFRLGGDEFVALAEGRHDVDPDVTSGLAVDVVGFDGTPASIEVTISAGFSALTLPVTLDGALAAVAHAIRAAKRDIGSTVVYASPELAAEDRWSYSIRVLDALDASEFSWWGQPIVDLSSGRPVAVELLCRWVRDGTALVNPADFLGIVSTFKRQRELGVQTLKAANQWLDAVDDTGLDDLQLTINVPPSHVANGLASDVRDIIDPRRWHRLMFEVLESEILDVNTNVVTALETVRDMGVRVLVDDFGAGYSAFSYLSDLPFDGVKLDQALIHGVDEHARREAIVRGIAPVFAELDMITIAEGVETVGEYAVVAAAGIHHAQGWHFARPAPMSECVPRLAYLEVQPTEAGLG